MWITSRPVFATAVVLVALTGAAACADSPVSPYQPDLMTSSRTALRGIACQRVHGTGEATAGVGGVLEGDLTGTFGVPTVIDASIHGPGLFLQTQFTDFDTNLGSFTTEDFFVFGPLYAPGESTARFNGRLEIEDGSDLGGFLHFHGTIRFTVVFVSGQPMVTLLAKFDYRGRLCSA